MKRIFLILLIFFVFQNSGFSIKNNGLLKWKTITTKHFRIHFNQKIEKKAQRVALLAENIYLKLTTGQKWVPFFRTEIVLTDNRDYANGSATTIPFNTVNIYLVRPHFKSQIGHFKLWLKTLLTHEFTHIVNLDSARGVMQGLRYIFGRNILLFPNFLQPIWIIEGNAVFQESQDNNAGRLNSSYIEMMMRIESKNFKRIDQASLFPREWPRGSVSYLYGAYFINYLEKFYGVNSFKDIFIANSNNIFPFLVNTNFKEVYHKSAVKLWKEWQLYQKKEYQKQISAIKNESLSKITYLTKSGSRTFCPEVSPNGKFFYYLEFSPYTGKKLMKMNIFTKKKQFLCRVNSPNDITISKKGNPLLVDLEINRIYSATNNLFSFNKNCYSRKTKKLRIDYIDFRKAFNDFVGIIHGEDKYSIVLLDKKFSIKKYLIKNSNFQIEGIKCSPDGEKITFSFRDKNGNTDIAILNITTKTILRITHDKKNDIDPSWNKTGTRILFSSDRDNGIYNIFYFDLNNKKIVRLTNVIGGLFKPKFLNNKKIIAESYHSKGFDIASINIKEKKYSEKQAETETVAMDWFSESKTIDDKDNNENIIYKTSNYTFWTSLLPSSWSPYLSMQEIYSGRYDATVGFNISGEDVLGFNSYYAGIYFYIVQNRFAIDAGYTFSYLYPDFFVRYSDDRLFYGDNKFPFDAPIDVALSRIFSRKISTGISIPLESYSIKQNFEISYNYSMATLESKAKNATATTTNYSLGSFNFSYSFDCTREYVYSISPENGRAFTFLMNGYHQYFLSDYNFLNIYGEYNEYLPSFWNNHVILLRAKGAVSLLSKDDNYFPFNLGRYSSGLSTQNSSDKFLGLRGFSTAVSYGNTIAIATVEYRFPVLQYDAGPWTFPLSFRNLWIKIFCDAGNIWDYTSTFGDFKTSLGIELNLELTLGYHYVLKSYLGFAYGFGTNGEAQVYFGVRGFFEGANKSKKNLTGLDKQ